jgi:uncharacterized cupin superfamily protein
MQKPILNLADLEFRAFGHGVDYPGAGQADEKFASRIGFIGDKIGAKKLGYNLTVVPPGKRAFPFHNHRVNEEMFFVVEGEGEIRIGSQRHRIRAGDVVACPPGGVESAHQIVNTSAAELKYLAVSTKISPEFVDYPDTGRFGLLVEEPAAADGTPRVTRFVGRLSQSLPYWEGE